MSSRRPSSSYSLIPSPYWLEYNDGWNLDPTLLDRAEELAQQALALGELELESGRSQQAFELLWPLVQDAHGGHASDEASRLLEEAGLLPGAGEGSTKF